MSTHNYVFEQKYEKYQSFLSENFQFLEVKFSIYLNRHVFVMGYCRMCLWRAHAWMTHNDDAMMMWTRTFCACPKAFFAWCGSNGRVRKKGSLSHTRKFEPKHGRTFNKTCVTNEDSDQPVHPTSMPKVLFHPSLDSPEAVEGTCDRQRLRSDYVDAQADLNLCWSYKSYCRFCRALAHL